MIKDCKVVCDGVEIANIECSKEGLSFKLTEEGKKMHEEKIKDCCNC